MVAHGIRQASPTSEADAFVRIGRHLYDREIPVPEFFLDDTFSGLVFLEDLGDINLQTLIQNTKSLGDIILYYQSVIDLLIQQSTAGARGFDSSWTYQTDTYNRSLILEKECRYFVEAFLEGYLGMDSDFDNFKDDFFRLADKALEHAVHGFMHRDMQSRNIMVKNNRFYFIDFQGGRLGPLQYDLASLLIDPYVALPFSVQKQLLDFCVEKIAALLDLDPDDFYAGYQYCAVTRNLQILGAFGYLSRIKSKTYFEKYIPTAVKTLKHNLSAFEDEVFPALKAIVNEL
jgi:aminoglycoside/choline kinase family phosphotransferase